MNPENIEKSGSIIGVLYANQALSVFAKQSHNSFNSLVSQLLTQRKMPLKGWPDQLIEHFLHELSLMDSNNYQDRAGVGEREGRVLSSLVNRRHYYMAHGIGRSGDLFSIQPKAPGSSLILKLTCYMAKHAIKLAGIDKLDCLVLPLATGMALTMCLLSLKSLRPQAKYVVWSRIDQKTCLKCISSAGLVPIILETQLQGDSVVTGDLENLLKTLNPLEIVCVLSTTSCFAPRSPDDVQKIAELCKEFNIPHVINNAYGLQCSKIMHMIKEALRIGRVDAIVQSTDKNFLVPVGGAIISSRDKELLGNINSSYPGRASMSPILDLFITFLTLGENGYLEILKGRKKMVPEFREKFVDAANKHGERVMDIRDNSISFAMTSRKNDLGAKLFVRRVSGCRLVGDKEKEVCGFRFKSYGSSFDGYPNAYLTAACAIGLTSEEMNLFFSRLDQLLE